MNRRMTVPEVLRSVWAKLKHAFYRDNCGYLCPDCRAPLHHIGSERYVCRANPRHRFAMVDG